MPKHRTARYRKIVDKVIETTAKRVVTPISVTDMCRAAGVSPRTLARAFHAVHGVPPFHYLCALRLAQARQVLLSGDEETVTEVAMRFGFRELGRFAALYRKRFGESPSVTLHRSSVNVYGLQGATPAHLPVYSFDSPPAERRAKKFTSCSEST